MRRYLVGLLAAYAATTTVLAYHWSVEAWFYRQCFDRLMQGKHGRPIRYSSLEAIYRDFGGFGLTYPKDVLMLWWLRGADSSQILSAVVGLVAACGLILPKYLGRRRRRGAVDRGGGD